MTQSSEVILSTTQHPPVPEGNKTQPVLFHAYFHLPISTSDLDEETRTVALLGQRFPVRFKDNRARKILNMEGPINVTFCLRQGANRVPKQLFFRFSEIEFYCCFALLPATCGIISAVEPGTGPGVRPMPGAAFFPVLPEGSGE